MGHVAHLGELGFHSEFWLDDL